MSEGALDIYHEALKAGLRQDYSEVVAEHAISPRNLSGIDNYGGFGIAADTDGETIAIWLKVEEGNITDASFTADGGDIIVAVGSMTTEIVKGKSVAKARRIGHKDILDALGGLPEGDRHYVHLAVEVLDLAIDDYLVRE